MEEKADGYQSKAECKDEHMTLYSLLSHQNNFKSRTAADQHKLGYYCTTALQYVFRQLEWHVTDYVVNFSYLPFPS